MRTVREEISEALAKALIEDSDPIRLAIEKDERDPNGYLNYYSRLSREQQILAKAIADLEDSSPNEIVDGMLTEMMRAYKFVHGLKALLSGGPTVH